MEKSEYWGVKMNFWTGWATWTAHSHLTPYIEIKWGSVVHLVHLVQNYLKVRLILTKSSFNLFSGEFYHHLSPEETLSGYTSFPLRVLIPHTLARLSHEGEGRQREFTLLTIPSLSHIATALQGLGGSPKE